MEIYALDHSDFTIHAWLTETKKKLLYTILTIYKWLTKSTEPNKLITIMDIVQYCGVYFYKMPYLFTLELMIII